MLTIEQAERQNEHSNLGAVVVKVPESTLTAKEDKECPTQAN